MYCPQCGAEFREGFTECSDCQVPLTNAPPPVEAPEPDMKLETIFETTDPGLLSVAKSILESAGVEYLSIGESAGGVFSGNPFLGKVKLQAESELAEEARALLAELKEGTSEEGPFAEDDESEDDAV